MSRDLVDFVIEAEDNLPQLYHAQVPDEVASQRAAELREAQRHLFALRHTAAYRLLADAIDERRAGGG